VLAGKPNERLQPLLALMATEWIALCQIIGRRDLLTDPLLSSGEGRRVENDTIDVAIAAWTVARRQRSQRNCF
jgi:crotonobetainyl-CoA:carnitine CoA-transferase CaiB-like acyl-CoA transferase